MAGSCLVYENCLFSGEVYNQLVANHLQNLHQHEHLDLHSVEAHTAFEEIKSAHGFESSKLQAAETIADGEMGQF